LLGFGGFEKIFVPDVKFSKNKTCHFDRKTNIIKIDYQGTPAIGVANTV
jgi:hypothetical protein